MIDKILVKGSAYWQSFFSRKSTKQTPPTPVVKRKRYLVIIKPKPVPPKSHYRFYSAVNKNTHVPYLIRETKVTQSMSAVEQPTASLVDLTETPVLCPGTVNTAELKTEEITSEKLGQRGGARQRSPASLYKERKRRSKKAKRKASNRTPIPPRQFVPPTVEPTLVDVAFLPPDPDQSNERNKTSIRLCRSRSTRRT